MSIILDLFKGGTSVKLPMLTEVKLTGADAEQFLQGQLTQNITIQTENSFFTASRLGPKGRIKFNLLINKISKSVFNLYVENSLSAEVISDFDKFIIMEEVELELGGEKQLYFNLNGEAANANIFGMSGKISELTSDSLIDYSQLELITGHYQYFKTSGESELFTNTLLCETALDLSKGCFVGQEVVSKVMVNRGAGNYPFLLLSKKPITHLADKEAKKLDEIQISDSMLTLCLVPRELRIHQSKIDSVVLFDCQKNLKDIANSLFLKAVDLNNAGSSEPVINLLQLALSFDDKNTDILETLGVLYGQLERYNEALILMDEILEIDSKHVMAHTNKSLFFMKQGKIEEAEKEKEISLKLSMNIEVSNEDEKEKWKNQLSMYEEVLEIDPEDAYALVQSIELKVKLSLFEEALLMARKTVKLYPNNPLAHLRLVQALQAKQHTFTDEMTVAFKIAAKSGDSKVIKELELLEKNG